MASDIQRKAVDSVNIDDRRTAAQAATREIYGLVKKMEEAGFSEKPSEAMAIEAASFFKSWKRINRENRGWIAFVFSLVFFFLFTSGILDFTGMPVADALIGTAVFFGAWAAVAYVNSVYEMRKSKYLRSMLTDGEKEINDVDRYIVILREIIFGPAGEYRKDVFQWGTAVFLFIWPAALGIAAALAQNEFMSRALAIMGAMIFYFAALTFEAWREVGIEKEDEEEDEEIEDEKEDSDNENYDFEQ